VIRGSETKESVLEPLGITLRYVPRKRFPETLPVAPGASETGSVCVSAYHDRNMDGMRDAAAEELLPNVEFRLSGIEGVVDAYTSDGVSEPHCFEQLPSGTYMVEARASTGYNSTTPDALAVPLLPNTTVNIEFGHQRGEGAAAVQNPPSSEGEGSAASAEGQSAEKTGDSKSDSLFSELGNVIIGVSGIWAQWRLAMREQVRERVNGVGYVQGAVGVGIAAQKIDSHGIILPDLERALLAPRIGRDEARLPRCPESPPGDVPDPRVRVR